MTPFNSSDFRDAWTRARVRVARLNAATPLQKTFMVTGGYAFGTLVSILAVCGYEALRWALYLSDDSCMQVVVDFLIFGAVFMLTTIPSACGGFYFLRPAAGFWKVFSWAALGFALMSLASLVPFFLNLQSAAAEVSFLSILLAPAAGLGFILGAIFAPERKRRKLLLAACAAEIMAFGGWFAFAAFHAMTGAR